MLVKDIMNTNPVCCLPDTSLQEVAEMMVEHDCGAIPVVEDPGAGGPLAGMITDRDIVCRILAEGKNPLEHSAQDCMTRPAITVRPDDSIEQCLRVMQDNQI